MLLHSLLLVWNCPIENSLMWEFAQLEIAHMRTCCGKLSPLLGALVKVRLGPELQRGTMRLPSARSNQLSQPSKGKCAFILQQFVVKLFERVVESNANLLTMFGSLNQDLVNPPPSSVAAASSAASIAAARPTNRKEWRNAFGTPVAKKINDYKVDN
uniref:Uncharacterized protein n=1 Tax=Romanomermis culicivorax TaxID=13658 RepID=A0A915KGS1_ROMCU